MLLPTSTISNAKHYKTTRFTEWPLPRSMMLAQTYFYAIRVGRMIATSMSMNEKTVNAKKGPKPLDFQALSGATRTT
jgi:hypothetical protein